MGYALQKYKGELEQFKRASHLKLNYSFWTWNPHCTTPASKPSEPAARMFHQLDLKSVHQEMLQLLTRPESSTTASQWCSEIPRPRRRPLTGTELADNTAAWIRGSAQPQTQERTRAPHLVPASHLLQEGGNAAHARTPLSALTLRVDGLTLIHETSAVSSW